MNRKRVLRLYRLEGLQLRMRVRRRKHIALHRGPLQLQRNRRSGGVWILCMILWPIDGASGCRLSSITGVAKVPCKRPVFVWRVRPLAKPSMVSLAKDRDHDRSRWIMGRNSNHGRSEIGPIGGVCNSTSFDRAMQWETPSLNRLTDDCETSV